MINRDDLLKMAQRDQRHTALEEAVAPLEILPTDLLEVLVDTRGEKHFRLHGYVMRRARDGSAWWFAVVDGNCVMAEALLRERGNARAFAGSPAYCRVRVATAEEEAAYLSA